MFGFRSLVAFDGSDLAKKAFDTAFGFIRTVPGSTMDVVFVEEIALMRNGVPVIDSHLQEHNDRVCALLEANPDTRSSAVTLHRLRGQKTSYVLLRFAEEHHNDLIVIGSRGLTGVQELLGSVSHAVVQHAKVPVLVIK